MKTDFPGELECRITIKGETGESKAKVLIEFDPSIGKENDKAWEGSGAMHLVSAILNALKNEKLAETEEHEEGEDDEDN